MSEQILSQTAVKINNQFFDIVEGSFKIKKGHGETEIITTIGEGGRVVNNIVEKPSTKRAEGSFMILNNINNQDSIDALIPLKGKLTVEGIDVNGTYSPVANASIINDPEWVASGDGVEIMFVGDKTVGVQ